MTKEERQEYGRRWRSKNKEKQKEYSHKTYWKHREKNLIKMKKYREENREYFKKKCADFYLKNGDRIRFKNRIIESIERYGDYWEAHRILIEIEGEIGMGGKNVSK